MSLQERLSQYKETSLSNTVVLTISATSDYCEYLDSKVSPHPKDPTDAFDTRQFSVGMKLAEDLFGVLPINKIVVYRSRLVIFFRHQEQTVRSVSLLASKSTESLCFQFPNPKINLEAWNLPDFEKINFDRMWQYIWIAHRNRVLGELHLDPPIPASNHLYTHQEIAEVVLEASPFSFESLDQLFDNLYPPVVKYGRWYDGQWHENSGTRR